MDGGADGQRSFLFRGGPIYPMAGPSNGSPRQGDALLTRGHVIAYVGPAAGLPRDRARGAELVELRGRPLLPGLCDSHLHLLLAARELSLLDLRGVADLAELQRRLRSRAASTPAESWIVGHGWEWRRLLVSHEPSPGDLDTATTRHPVFLTSKDLHSVWLNTPGLACLRRLPRLPDDSVLHEVGGRPSGLVFENVFALQRQLLPPSSAADKQRLVAAFARHLHACGLTAVHTVEEPDDVTVVRRAVEDEGTPRVRVLGHPVFETPEDLRAGAALFDTRVEGWLAMGGAKLFADGSFGTLTAAVSHPYAGTSDRGLLNLGHAELGGWLAAIRDVGTSAMVHAIGDRAVGLVLEALQGFSSWPPGTHHRIEHAQLLSRRILERHSLAGVVFSGQPSHMPGDRDIVERHLPDGTGRRWAYPYRTMQDRGALVVFGSDAPVELVDPWKGIHAAVTRLDAPDVGPWIGAERITVADALAAHTSRPARLHEHAFATGVLAPGRLADLVVLNRDPFVLAREEPDALRDGVHADLTFLDGACVYRRRGVV